MLTLEYAKNPISNSVDKQQILLIVKWQEFKEEMPFNACVWDPEPWGQDLYRRACAGEFGTVADYTEFIPPVINFEPTPTHAN